MNLNVFRGLTAVRGQGFNMHVFADDLLFLGGSDETLEELEDSDLLELCDRMAKKKGLPADEQLCAEPKQPPDDDDVIITDLF